MNPSKTPEESPREALTERIRSGDRRALAKAITLIENRRPDQRRLADRLISQLMQHTGTAIRVGITGAPGVGKSTFIEALGLHLIGRGHRLAVLAVDPSSKISGGSILGDRVRMERLSREPNAFIRPSPSSGSLGGVTRRTRESMLLCEAAGFDVVLVETVGVGQSEVTVCDMVDFFMVLLPPNAGDEIQGIKKGIVEMADALIINKADGELLSAARRAAGHYQSALHLLRPKYRDWHTPVQCVSALSGMGIPEVWDLVRKHRSFLSEHDLLQPLRRHQTHLWFQAALRDGLLEALRTDRAVQARLPALEEAMGRHRKSPHECAEEIIELFFSNRATREPASKANRPTSKKPEPSRD